MGIREKLQENQPLSVGILAVVILAILFGIYQMLWKKPEGPKPYSDAYYSDDDGQSWFIDSSSKIPPFDHNGKIAVRAYLFRCGPSGKPFIQYLLRYDDNGLAMINRDIQRGMTPFQAQLKRGPYGVLIKRPGEAKWLSPERMTPDDAAAYAATQRPDCPSGARAVDISERVLP